jgi:hypothetical protein
VTSFSNSEEKSVGKERLVPFLLEDKLKELGAHYNKVACPSLSRAFRVSRVCTARRWPAFLSERSGFLGFALRRVACFCFPTPAEGLRTHSAWRALLSLFQFLPQCKSRSVTGG